MAILNFPHVGLTIGQKYPASPVAGVPTYTWDGEKWTTQADAIAGDVYVKKAGDTMTGDLKITKADPSVTLNKTDINTCGWIGVQSNGLDRWWFALGSNTHLETGGNSGSDFELQRYADNGAIIDAPLMITRATGQVLIQNDVVPPLYAARHTGIQINGAFEVSQELGDTGTGVADGYICDGWQLSKAGPGAITAQRVTIGLVSGFNCVLSLNVGTAETTPLTSTSNYGTFQAVEGYRITHLMWGTPYANSITISFYSLHDVAGVYSVSVSNGSIDRSYVTTYTHTSAGALQYNTITIPGCTTGTWNTTNGIGLYIGFTIASGSLYTAPAANTWYNTNYLTAPGQVNGVATTGKAFRLAGVVVLIGSIAPQQGQIQNFTRPYGEELVTCMRYYQWMGFNVFFNSYGVNDQAGCPVLYPVPMRAAPTVGGLVPEAGMAADTNHNSSGAASVTPISLMQYVTAPGAGASYIVGYRMALDARL